MNSKLLHLFFAFCASASLVGCGGSTKEAPETFSDCTVSAVDFGIDKIIDDDDLLAEFMAGVASDNRPTGESLCISPYFKDLKINDVSIPVFGTITANSLHSFAYIDIEKVEPDKRVNLEVSFSGTSMKKSFKKVDVLPLSNEVVASFEKKKVTATIHDTGNYSFVFNSKQDEALTIVIANKDKKENHLENRTLVEIEPGDYYDNGDLSNLDLSANNTLYFFKKGLYKVGNLNISEGSALYFEEGTRLKLYPDGGAPISSNNKNNIGIYGHGLLDYSDCNGSQLNAPKDDRPGKGGLSISNCDKVNINGLMIINAQTWQCCLNCSTNIHITNCMFYGYRTYADGIMLNNCQDAVVEYNFIRTGDDAFETKSTSGDMLTKNVIFQYNSAWTDKAVAYGCIYESKNDTSDVHFLHNSVGFASGSWSKHLGCAVIQMGNNPLATMHDIEFDDMEIFYSCNQALCNIYIGGSGGMGAGSGTVKDIYFKNISCVTNAAYMLNLQTYDDENCFIKRVYMDNIESNGIQLTAENYRDYCSLDGVVGGYPVNNLTINGVKCK